MNRESVEIISEDLSYTKYYPQNLTLTLPFRGFWYISYQICDAFSDYSEKIQEYFEQIQAYYKNIDSLSVEQRHKLIKAILYIITYKNLPIQKPHKLIFYISSAVTKIKGFMKVIRNPARFILNLKAIYKSIKEIKWSKGSTKGKETAISRTQKYFDVLKEKPSWTYKALNILLTSRKFLEENLIKFSSEASPLVSPTLLIILIKKLNLITLKTTSKSFLNSPESSTSITSSLGSSNSSNIMAVRGKMIV